MTKPPTPSQIEVIFHFSRGHIAKTIAPLVGIGVDMVNLHVKNAKARTGTNTIPELVGYCIRRGLIPAFAGLGLFAVMTNSEQHRIDIEQFQELNRSGSEAIIPEQDNEPCINDHLRFHQQLKNCEDSNGKHEKRKGREARL